MLKLELHSSKTIECFHGIRALSAFWIIAGHRINELEKMLQQPSHVDSVFAKFIITVLRTNQYAVDTFFLMSGILFTQCLEITWYLSTDFQLIVISPLFIFILWKYKYKAFWLFVAIICSTQLGIFFARYNDTIPSREIYGQTHFRIAQYLIGIGLGYKMNDLDVKHFMRKRYQLIGWLASFSIFIGIQIIRETYRNQRFAEAFFSSVHRIAFVGLVSWIIYVCHYLKSGGIVNWFLSQPLWQPIAKISLSIYLIHTTYIIMSNVNSEDCMHLNATWLMHILFGDFVIATLLASILYLVIEAPSNLIIKYLIK
ncbi:O-acyltransferase like protein-like [Bradysia coprophila]|uniref:O-acyltransferase like protein-like n=1 Tax=Bradysia coprophila TaxID=38358 RepID=UPI00187DBBAB|nr:O-acyltransferase like protein-like [Bradysia coprophila]